MSDATTSNQRMLNLTGAAVAIMLVWILAGGIYLLATRDIPEKNHDILLVLITSVASSVSLVIGYFFGSSSGNKAKDDALNTAISTAAKAQDALAPLVTPDKVIPIKANETVAVHASGSDAKPTEQQP
jgi:hypothetical protein